MEARVASFSGKVLFFNFMTREAFGRRDWNEALHSIELLSVRRKSRSFKTQIFALHGYFKIPTNTLSLFYAISSSNMKRFCSHGVYRHSTRLEKGKSCDDKTNEFLIIFQLERFFR